jgi:hypothetical protein
MLINAIQGTTTHLVGLLQGGDALQRLFWQLSVKGSVVAQYIDVDIMGDMEKAFDHFIKTGQVWALLIGVVVGYLIRSATAY